MTKKKRLISLGVLLLVAVIACLSVFLGVSTSAANEEDKLVASDEGDSYGIYTNLTLSLDGGDGQVWATVKNRLTILPSSVTVKVELYNSEKYYESYEDMTLVSENYIADLNYGKTITATASTGGVTKYWKARMCYRIDSDGWKERATNTIQFNQSGTVTGSIVSKDATEYYISDFLPTDAESVYVSIYPYVFEIAYDDSYWIGDAFVWLENEEELLSIKNLFGEIKLDPFDLDTKTQEEVTAFYLSEGRNAFDMHLEFGDGSFIKIYIGNRHKELLGANLFVQYDYFDENGNKIHRCFTSSISDEAANALYELIKNIYEN